MVQNGNDGYVTVMQFMHNRKEDNMKLQYMEELLALEQYENYTLASQQLFISQSTLSRHINIMEKELGTMLINRNTHSVEFTEDGKDACKTFRKILNLYNNYSATLQEKSAGITGTLRLGMLYYTIYQDFGKVLPLFEENYPQIEIKQYSYQPHEIYWALINDKIDIGVLAKANYETSDNLNFKDISRNNAVAMMSTTHRLASCKTVKLDDLHHELIVLLNEDTCTSIAVQEAFARCDFTPEKIIYTDHINTVPFTILKTNGIHINESGFSLPGYEDKITILPIEEPELYFTKSFVYKRDNTNSAIPLFLNTILE